MTEFTIDNTINAIVQEWTAKFGTTVENLIPEMQKYYIVHYTVVVVAWLIVFLVMLITGRFLINKHNEIEKSGCCYDDDELHYIGYTVCVCSAFIFIIICYFTTVLIQWIVSPQASMISKLMDVFMSTK